VQGIEVFELLGIAAAVMTGLMVAAIVMVGVLMVKTLFFLVTLPFRAVFALLFFPIWLVKSVFRLLATVILFPLVVLLGLAGIVVAALAAVAAILLPLIPIVIVCLLLWAVFRSFRPATGMAVRM
jgi:hypothetical protein